LIEYRPPNIKKDGRAHLRRSYLCQQMADNGSGYIADETRAFARDIGLIPRRTPYRSP
jgi:hypothetical protein